MRPLPFSKRQGLINADPESLIRVYSRQHVDAYQVAKNIGWFSGSHDFKEDHPQWVKAYTWMKDQMDRVVPDFTGEYPIWGFVKRPLHKSPWKIWDDVVQITALVPRKRILFSDYDLWHMALNNSPIHNTENEFDDWYDRDFLNPESTWHKCLNIRRNDISNTWLGMSENVQACIDRIYISEIVSVKYPKVG